MSSSGDHNDLRLIYNNTKKKDDHLGKIYIVLLFRLDDRFSLDAVDDELF